ncbi:unnamed protein product, partial [Prorocentrum cordatum]
WHSSLGGFTQRGCSTNKTPAIRSSTPGSPASAVSRGNTTPGCHQHRGPAVARVDPGRVGGVDEGAPADEPQAPAVLLAEAEQPADKAVQRLALGQPEAREVDAVVAHGKHRWARGVAFPPGCESPRGSSGTRRRGPRRRPPAAWRCTGPPLTILVQK